MFSCSKCFANFATREPLIYENISMKVICLSWFCFEELEADFIILKGSPFQGPTVYNILSLRSSEAILDFGAGSSYMTGWKAA
jgi:hypothetical protein